MYLPFRVWRLLKPIYALATTYIKDRTRGEELSAELRDRVQEGGVDLRIALQLGRMASRRGA
jgi:hypothetical protein